MGIFAALLSAVFSTSKDVVSKKLSVRIDGMASTFASFAFALPFYLMVLGALWLADVDILHFSVAFWWLVLLRALTDSMAEGMKMYAFAHGDISLVTIAFSLSPLGLLALSPLLTDDQLSTEGVLAVVVVTVGSVALVWRPTHPDWGRQKKAVFLALGASCFFALNSILDRLAVQQKTGDPGTAVVAGFTMTAVSATLIFPVICWGEFRKGRVAKSDDQDTNGDVKADASAVQARHGFDGLYYYRRGLSVRGMLEVAFMVCKLFAMQYLAAAYVVGLQRSSLVLSIIAGRIVFKEGDFKRRMFAGVLIMAGVGWIVWDQAKGY